MSFAVQAGFPDAARPAVAALYWEAFGGKLGRVMRPEPRALAFVARVMRPDHALAAVTPDGAVIGVAGFKTAEAAFVGGGLGDLAAVYGPLGAVWRAALLGLLARDRDNRRFLVDGIFVRADARGTGVGGALIDAVCAEARGRGYGEVRLDVVDANPRARALYERKGFAAIGRAEAGLLRHVFDFRGVTTMVRRAG